MDPGIEKILTEYNKTPQHLRSPTEEREALLRFTTLYGGKRLSVRRIEDIRVKIDGAYFNLRIFRPSTKRNLPCMLYFPIGGWVRAGLGTHDALCRYYTNLLNCVVVLAEVRLAPEYKFPVCVHDGIRVYKWLVLHAKKMGIDSTQIGIGGDSSGGNVAAAVTNFLRYEAIVQPIFQLLIYPPLDLHCQSPTYETYGSGFFATKERMVGYVNLYLNGDFEKNDPRASPIFEPKLEGLPKTFIVVGGFDPVQHECKLYAQRLRDSGVPVYLFFYEGFIHAFMLMTILPSVQKALEEICADLRAKVFKS